MPRVLMLIFLVFLFSVSCDGTAPPDSPEEIESNYIDYNGTRYDITNVTIWYWGQERYINLYFGTANYLVLSFDVKGDPTLETNHYKIGTWTAIDDIDFYHIRLFTGGSNEVFITSSTAASTYTTTVTIGGKVGTDITLDGDFTFNSDVECSWHYSGIYDYEAD